MQNAQIDSNNLTDLVDNAPNCAPGISQIHGYGLFAKQKIAVGEVIADFSDPSLYEEKRFDELEEWRLEGGKYTGLDEERCVVSNRFTKYSLMNHSRTANAAQDRINRNIYALRDIEPGEAITLDYRLEPVSAKAKSYSASWL